MRPCQKFDFKNLLEFCEHQPDTLLFRLLATFCVCAAKNLSTEAYLATWCFLLDPPDDRETKGDVKKHSGPNKCLLEHGQGVLVGV